MKVTYQNSLQIILKIIYIKVQFQEKTKGSDYYEIVIDF